VAISTVIRNCRALIPSDDRYDLVDCDIITGDGAISAVVAPNTAVIGPEDSVMSGDDRLVVPGLINAHSHSPSNMVKGTADGMGHIEFMWTNQADSFGRSEEEIYASAVLGCVEMIRRGVTAVIDHYPEQNCTTEAVAPVVRAYADTGMRAAIALRIFDLPYDDIDPEHVEGIDETLKKELARENPLSIAPADELAATCREVVDRWHRHEGRISIFPGPSNTARCSDELLVHCFDIAEEHDLGLHAHMLETRVQKEITFDRHGRTMPAHLDALGVLCHRWSFAHSVWVDDDDIDLLASRGAVVVHNPESNAKIGVGSAPVARMLDRGVTVALGTDGASTNDNQNMHEAMNLAVLLPRILDADRSSWFDAHRALAMATTSGAKALNMAGQLGAIAPGMRADLVLYDLNSVSMAPLNDVVQQLVFCERGESVVTVMVDGQIVYDNGRFAFGDADAIIRDMSKMRRAQLDRNPALYRVVRQLAAKSRG